MIELYAYCGVCFEEASTAMDRDGLVTMYPCVTCAKRNRKDNKALQFLLDIRGSVVTYRQNDPATGEYKYTFKITEEQYITMKELMKEE